MVNRRSGIVRVGIAAATVSVAGLTVVQTASAHGGDDDRFRGNLRMLNHSGVTGHVRLEAQGGQIEVELDARGLETGQLHMSHIHGFGDGEQATCPRRQADADGDGVLTFAEGLPDYGPVMVGLGNDEVMDDGRLEYERTFTMTAGTGIPPNAPVAELGDLDQYVVVVHGMTLEDNPDTAELDPGYVPSLPVACAVIREH